MKLNSLAALAALFVLVSPLVAQDKQGKPDKKADKPAAAKVEHLKPGSVVDEKLELVDLDGKKLTFKELRGKVVVVHFWSTMCPFEQAADPKFSAMTERFKGKDVVFLAINSNQNEIGKAPAADAKRAECYADIREYMKKEKMTFPVYVDHGNKLSDLFDGRTTPHCFVIDKKGALVYAGALDDDPKGDKGDKAKNYVVDAVDASLAGKEVAVKETKPYGCGVKR